VTVNRLTRRAKNKKFFVTDDIFGKLHDEVYQGEAFDSDDAVVFGDIEDDVVRDALVCHFVFSTTNLVGASVPFFQ